MTFQISHTPAPWHVVGRGNGRQQLPIRSSTGTEIAVLTHGHLADAYLLAAAPDLLETLDRIEMAGRNVADTMHRKGTTGDPLLDEFLSDLWNAANSARAVIAKAKGQS